MTKVPHWQRERERACAFSRSLFSLSLWRERVRERDRASPGGEIFGTHFFKNEKKEEEEKERDEAERNELRAKTKQNACFCLLSALTSLRDLFFFICVSLCGVF